MPRKPKAGGYSNRTDLTNAPSQPARVAPGGAYGSRQASLAAQKALPLPQSNQLPTPPTQGDNLAALQNYDVQPVGLGAPSTRPGEPVTAGIGIGAGPNAPSQQVINMGPGPDVMAWRPYMPMLEMLASQPDASPDLRAFYRRLRAQMPPDSQAV